MALSFIIHETRDSMNDRHTPGSLGPIALSVMVRGFMQKRQLLVLSGISAVKRVTTALMESAGHFAVVCAVL